MSDYAYPYSALAAGVLSQEEFQQELMSLLLQNPKEAENALNYLRMLALEGFLDERTYIDLRKRAEIHAAKAAFAAAKRASFDPDATINYIDKVTPIQAAKKTEHNRRATDKAPAPSTQESDKKAYRRQPDYHEALDESLTDSKFLTEDDIPPPDAGYFTDRASNESYDYEDDTTLLGAPSTHSNEEDEETRFLPHDTSEAADLSKAETLARALRASIGPLNAGADDTTLLRDALEPEDFSEDPTGKQETLERAILRAVEEDNEPSLDYNSLEIFSDEADYLDDDTFNTGGVFNAEGSLPAEGSYNAEGSLPAEGSYSAEGSYLAEDQTQATQQRLHGKVDSAIARNSNAAHRGLLEGGQLEETVASQPKRNTVEERASDAPLWREHSQLLLAMAAAIGLGLLIYLAPAPAPPEALSSTAIGTSDSSLNATAPLDQGKLSAVDSQATSAFDEARQAELNARREFDLNSETTSISDRQDYSLIESTPEIGSIKSRADAVSDPVEILNLVIKACESGRIEPEEDASSALAYLSQLEANQSPGRYIRLAKAEIAQAYLEKAKNAREAGDWAEAEASVAKAVSIRISENSIRE